MARGNKVALACEGGDVTLDRTADIRGSFRATLVDPNHLLTPSGANDQLLPLVNEVTIYRGVIKGFGVIERFALGTFGISHAVGNEADGQITVEVDGFDRAERIRRPLAAPFSLASGIPWSQTIQTLIRTQFPTATFAATWPPVASSTQLLLAAEVSLDAQGDVWAECLRGAAALGKELYADSTGAFTLGEIPHAAIGTAAWNFVEGSNATQVDTGKGYSADQTFNGVIVTSSTSDVRGEAWDDNPANKTSRPNVGPRPKTITRNVGSTVQAESVARSELIALLAGSEEITFTAIPNAALDVGDLVAYRNDRLAINGNYIINKMTLPLDRTSLMSVTIGKN